MGRVTVGKTMESFYAKTVADPSVWNTKAGRAEGKSRHAADVNKVLDRTNMMLNARLRELRSRHETVTALQVKQALQGLLSGDEYVVRFTSEYNADFDARKDRARGTKYQNGYALKHLREFLHRRRRLTDIPFRDLTPSFIEEYDRYLRYDLKLKPGTVIEITRHLRMMVGYAMERGIISADPFADYGPPRPEHPPRSIPMHELEKMMAHGFDDRELCLARDMFVFESFTGLCYIDAYNLTESGLAKDADGVWWIRTYRQKTGKPCNIPLLDLPLEIIDRYRGFAPAGKLLPMPEYGVYRRRLKKIARLCGIEHNVTSHRARHTYATEVTLSNGVPVESVKSMLGHGSISSTLIYSRVTDEKIDRDMSALERRIEGRYRFTI
jgi:integrase